MTTITIADGKYTVAHEDGANLRALRHGEPWRSLTGDGLVLAMAQEIEQLREQLAGHAVLEFIFEGELPDAKFVEVEDGHGNSIRVGEWDTRDGYCVLRVTQDRAIADAVAWCNENGGTPAEFLSYQRLVKLSHHLGRPLTWKEAIDLQMADGAITADEHAELLKLDDEPQSVDVPGAIQQVKAAQLLVAQRQATLVTASVEWHHCKDVDDRLHEALEKLGD